MSARCVLCIYGVCVCVCVCVRVCECKAPAGSATEWLASKNVGEHGGLGHSEIQK